MEGSIHKDRQRHSFLIYTEVQCLMGLLVAQISHNTLILHAAMCRNSSFLYDDDKWFPHLLQNFIQIVMVCGFGRRKESGARIPWHGIAVPGIQTPKNIGCRQSPNAVSWLPSSWKQVASIKNLQLVIIPISKQSQLQFAHCREEKAQAIL